MIILLRGCTNVFQTAYTALLPFVSHGRVGGQMIWNSVYWQSQRVGTAEAKDPVLLKDTANQSQPSSTPTLAHPSTPPSSNEPPLAPKAHKMHEEFTTCDLNHLLAAVLAVNPYVVPRMKIGEKWREVATLVQEKGFCQNREADTLKNKVSSMLTWVESPLGRVLEKDPVTFAGLYGKLDAVQHLKIQAKDTLEEQKEHTKELGNQCT
ncbi:hypothetical protein JB92DRAFT_3104463 [Gautieria morchelliformis]|nr:hypothetical protein JB92DRAFT_3104463 [Gautieria morchelliformis]